MRSMKWFCAALIVGICAAPSLAQARAFSVSVWTNRGNDAVYQPGEALEIKAKTSDDGYLLVYEIDSEGYVHLLYPDRHSRPYVEGGVATTLGNDPDYELVAQGPVGQGYIVAIGSLEGFRDIPWYLRPYDSQAEEIGYYGGPEDDENEEQGVTAEGRIVGDPFVAMERIRRRVLQDPEDSESFATSYTSYYIHNEVRYPRYLCYDCHRENHWSWWDGFDPYYTSCSTFNFRVNWSWWWGPSYWTGFVPYYVYVYRPDCPPRYRPYLNNGATYSSWDGWKRWRSQFGERLTRYKSTPPPDYVPPDKFVERGKARVGDRIPPGFMARGGRSRDPGNAGRPGRLVRDIPRGRMLDPDRREARDGSGSGKGNPTPGIGRARRERPIEPGNRNPDADASRERRDDPAPTPEREPVRRPRSYERQPRQDRPDQGRSERRAEPERPPEVRRADPPPPPPPSPPPAAEPQRSVSRERRGR